MNNWHSEPIIQFIKTAKAGYVVISAIFCVIGVFLLLNPEISLNTLCYLLAAVLSAFGVIKIIGYFSRDLYRLAFQYDLAFGILLLTLGMIMFLYYRGILPAFDTIFGILLLADGLFRIQLSIDAKAFGIKAWWLILALAIAAGVCGVLLVLHPVESGVFVMQLLGVAFLFEGGLSMSVALCAVKVTAGRSGRSSA